VIAGPVVIDASVVVEYLVALKLTGEASRLFARLRDVDTQLELWAPDLIFPEVLSALRKLVWRRAIPARAGERAVEQLIRLPILASGSSALMRDVWRLRGALTPYDACYVALARRLRAPFVTADGRLARALSRRRDRVLHLSEVS
jgi:predicted nucleic acid-binding protein